MIPPAKAAATALRGACAAAALSLCSIAARGAWTSAPLPASAAPDAPGAYPCDVRRWHQDIVKEGGRAIVAPLCGDLRGDGVERMYAALDRGPAVELELRADGPHSDATLAPTEYYLAVMPTFIAPYKAGGNPSLFIGGVDKITIATWSEGRWQSETIPGSNGRDLTALAVGDGRGDGRTRVYAASGGTLIEYAPTPIGWSRDEFSPRLGTIQRLALEPRRGKRAARLVVDAASGRYALRWRFEGRVAVLDFAAVSLAPGVAAGFSDLLRTRLLEIGNCRLVERSAVDAVLREKALRASALVDPAAASRAAALLGADRVIIGTLGRESGANFADIRVVSPKTGSSPRAEYVRWSDRGEEEKAVELLAQAACPDTSRPR